MRAGTLVSPSSAGPLLSPAMPTPPPSPGAARILWVDSSAIPMGGQKPAHAEVRPKIPLRRAVSAGDIHTLPDLGVLPGETLHDYVERRVGLTPPANVASENLLNWFSNDQDDAVPQIGLSSAANAFAYLLTVCQAKIADPALRAFVDYFVDIARNSAVIADYVRQRAGADVAAQKYIVDRLQKNRPVMCPAGWIYQNPADGAHFVTTYFVPNPGTGKTLVAICNRGEAALYTSDGKHTVPRLMEVPTAALVGRAGLKFFEKLLRSQMGNLTPEGFADIFAQLVCENHGRELLSQNKADIFLPPQHEQTGSNCSVLSYLAAVQLALHLWNGTLDAPPHQIRRSRQPQVQQQYKNLKNMMRHAALQQALQQLGHARLANDKELTAASLKNLRMARAWLQKHRVKHAEYNSMLQLIAQSKV